MLGRIDGRIHDSAALDEIWLTGELIVAASESDGPLTVERIDAILGLAR